MNKLRTSNIIIFLIISGISILSCTKKDEITQEEIINAAIHVDTVGTTDTIGIGTTTYPFDTLDIPYYNPDFWNDGKGYNTIQNRHNCYAYATNNYYEDTLVSGAMPGKISGIEFPHPFSAQDCIDAAVADGLIVLNGEEEPPLGWCKLALFLELEPSNTDGTQALDFHWFRRDKNGYWSNKGGATPVTNLDVNGVPISDPRQSGYTKHTYFVTFMAVKSSTHQGQGQTPVE
ncbi:MAG: hypothetical protein ACEPOV_09020 [Hyphomicrobiales bacterium]